MKMNVKYDPDVKTRDDPSTANDPNRDQLPESPYYFGDLMLMVTLEDTLVNETLIALPVGITVILKLEIGGCVTGYIYITPHTPLGEEPKKVYADKFGEYPWANADQYNDDRDFDVGGGIILEPYVMLSVGAAYGVGVVSLDGKALFYMVFSTTDSGSGTVTLNATVRVEVLGFEVYKDKFAQWQTDLFGNPRAQLSSMLNSESMNSSAFQPVSRDYLNNRTGWTGDDSNLQNPGPGVTGFTEQLLMRGIYPHPDTQLMRIDEDSLLMVFVEDDPSRTDANRGAIYYSVSHDNGITFAEPFLLSDDGTLDSHPRLEDLGGRILLLYSSLSGHVTESMSMEDILELNELEMAFFDKGTCQFTQPVEVSRYTGRANPGGGGLLGDYYSDVNGNAVYDADSGQVLIIFEKTDYTSDADDDFHAVDLFDSYGTIAYMLYDTGANTFLSYDEEDYPDGLTAGEKGQWDQDWYGQRFLNTEIMDESLPGGVLSDPLVFDLTAKMKDRTAYIAYTVDTDGDLETIRDRDIYLQTYSFADKTFTRPVKISDMKEEATVKADGRPQLVLYHGDMYLFFHADTGIHYYDVDDLLEDLNSPDRLPVVMEDDPATEEIESGSYDPDDYLLIAPRTALSYSEEHLPVNDYQVAVGDDGKLYLVWTEPATRLAEGVEPGSHAALQPENIYQENQIYAAMFYENIGHETNRDYGRWSGKVQITDGPGSYTDPSVSVMADGRLIVAAKKNEKVLVDDSQAAHRVENRDTTELVALRMTPIPVAAMNEDAITFTTDYPLPKEAVNILATAGNHGLMPVLNPVVDFYAVQGDTETLIGARHNSDPVYGGQEVVFCNPWKAPENLQDMVIVARLRSGDNETVLAQVEKAFPYGIKLEYSLFDLDYIAQNCYRAYLEVHHTGNQPLENAELVINRIDLEKQPHELKRVPLDNETAALEMFVIDENFEIPQQDLIKGYADIEVRVEKEGKLLASQTARVEKNISAFHRELLDQVNEVAMEASNMTLTRGERRAIQAEVHPAAAAEKNSFLYVSSNPAVAKVNEAGVITALTSGSAVITAYAVPKVDVSTQTEDGYMVTGSILDNLALEDCKSAALSVTVQAGSSGGNKPGVPTEDNVPGSGSNTPVTITGNGGTLVIGQNVLEGISKGAQSETFSFSVIHLGATDMAQIYDISLKHGDTPVTGLENARAQVSIPYTLQDDENPNAIVVYAVTGTGELIINPTGKYKDGMVTFYTSDFTRFGIAHNLVQFEDVVPAAWYADAVTYIAARNIAEGIGDNRFAPLKPMSREEFAKFLALAYGFTWSGKNAGFIDVAQGSWYEPYVNALYEAGIISGIGDGKFGTGQFITRQDMVTMLFNALQNSGANLSKVRNYKGFDDENQVAIYAQPAVQALYEAGILNGVGNNLFAPNNTANRASMTVILMNAMNITMDRIRDISSLFTGV
jgi:hypothetical protein